MPPEPIRIAGREVSPDAPPLIVAELSGNHDGSLERALAIVDAAAKAGAHAIKLQTYTADTMTLRGVSGEGFVVDKEGSPWRGEGLWELYDRAATPWAWHEPIFDRCREHGLIGFSTPFDRTAVEFLEGLGVPCWKVASFENVDHELIALMARTGKPVIMSTGMATVVELAEAVETARGAGCRDLVLLKCTSSYPADPRDSHLRTLPHLRELFGCQVGISDHTLGIGATLAAVALGACVVERHVTLSRDDGAVDSTFSLEPAELAALCRESEVAWRSLGAVHYGPSPGEVDSKAYRRTLYITADLPAGAVLSRDNVRALRPGFGLPCKYLPIVLGKRVSRPVARGTPLAWDLIG